MISGLIALLIFLVPQLAIAGVIDVVVPAATTPPISSPAAISASPNPDQARQDLIKRLLALIQILKRLIVQKQAELLITQPITTSLPISVSTLTSPVSPAIKPFIASVSPNHGSMGTSVTITGGGFTPTANRVYTGYDDFYLSSPDGRTLTFTVDPPIPPELSRYKEATFPDIIFRFYVRNSSGLSQLPGQFELDILN